MTHALRWATMSAILMFYKSWETKSQDSIHRPQLLKRKESRSGFEPRLTYQPNALPLGQTGSLGNAELMIPFYTAPFSAGEQTHIVLVVCVWISDCCCSTLFYVHRDRTDYYSLRDGGPRTYASSFTQLQSSECVYRSTLLHRLRPQRP